MKRLLNGKDIRLCVDQYGCKFYVKTVKELLEKCGRKRASKVYVDKKDGRTMHVGYVIGNQWFTVFAPCEVPA